jgi:hypothetical protein
MNLNATGFTLGNQYSEFECYCIRAWESRVLMPLVSRSAISILIFTISVTVFTFKSLSATGFPLSNHYCEFECTVFALSNQPSEFECHLYIFMSFSPTDFLHSNRYFEFECHCVRAQYTQAKKINIKTIGYLLLPLALQPFVGFGFLREVIPCFSIRC